MKKFYSFIFIILLLAGTAHAATLEDDHVHACDRKLDISPALIPSALLLSASADIDAKRFDLVYRRYAQLFEATLLAAERNDPEVARFVDSIPRATSLEVKYFDVTHEADLKAEVFFSGTANEIVATCKTLKPYFANMASVALMTRWVRSQEILPDLERRASFVAHQSKAHEALLFNGLPMWPWELWLNGKRLGKDDWEPLFKTQLVFMRPVAGVGIDTGSGIAGNLNVGVGVEPVGFVRYQDDDYKSWWGVSLLLTSNTNAGTGVGGLLRWNSYVLGMTHHESTATGMPGGNFVFIGVELFDLFNKKRDDFNEWKQLHKDRIEKVLH